MTFTELSSPSITSTKPTSNKPWHKHWLNRANLPTMYDLPSEDPEEPGLPDEFHDYQPALLSETFKLQDYSGENSFCAADLNLYYDVEHRWYKRPDWFGVLGKPAACESDELRRSYVVWQEGMSPFIVVELISPGTENEDFGRTTSESGKPPTKWTVYERILKIPYYVIYDRYTDTISGFRLVKGRYQAIEIGADRKIWLPEANAGLGIWEGQYNRFNRRWLRWYSKDGWILTDNEYSQQQLTESQRQIAESQQQLTESQRQIAEGQRQVVESQQQLTESQQQIAVQQNQLLAERMEKERIQQEAEAMRQQNALLQEKLKTLGQGLTDLDTDNTN